MLKKCNTTGSSAAAADPHSLPDGARHLRELIKLATLSAALVQGLRARGVGESEASLAAEVGIAVFRVAFAQWVSPTERRGYAEIVGESLRQLQALTAR